MFEPSTNEEFLSAMDHAANVVAHFTGLKRQFVDAGWSEEHAEAMVISITNAVERGHNV